MKRAVAIRLCRRWAMKLRQTVLLFIVVSALLLVSGAALAKENKTPFTGIEYITGEVWEGRYWEPGPNLVFWRGTTFIKTLETTDPRVTGTACADHNGNYQPSDDPNAFAEGQMWGKMWIYPPMELEDGQPFVCGEGDFVWEGSFVGDRANDGSEHLKYNLKGRGVYEGLQIRYESWAEPLAWYSVVAGEVLDPGK
jgi:hypothetical protein